ncbi:MAG TPA: site-specific integrase [Solirubrobacteraceae bacterium]|nr:site-specific integrase [Solirubrobacteraceae bacterium]
MTYQVQIPNPGYPAPDPKRPGKLVPERVVKTFDLKRDAERWLNDQASAINRGDFIDPRDKAKPFRELVATWERTRKARLAPKTQERYDGLLRVYLMPAFGSTPLGQLRRSMLKEWFAELDVSPATARKIQVALSSVLSEGVEMGVLRENPAARLKLAALPRREMTVLTAAEVRALSEAMYRPTDRLAVYVAAYTGVRAGELWALQRKHIDLDGRRLIVERTLTSVSGRLIFRNATKTDGSRRVISLPTFLANRLAEHLATLDPDPNTLLFTGPGGSNGRKAGLGGPIRHSLFRSRIFRPAVVAALPPEKHNLRWHDLRHTCASLLIHSGASILLVQKRLGHASSTTTLDLYGWLFPSTEAAMAGALDAIYNAADAENVVPLDRSEQVA